MTFFRLKEIERFSVWMVIISLTNRTDEQNFSEVDGFDPRVPCCNFRGFTSRTLALCRCAEFKYSDTCEMPNGVQKIACYIPSISHLFWISKKLYSNMNSPHEMRHWEIRSGVLVQKYKFLVCLDFHWYPACSSVGPPGMFQSIEHLVRV